MHAYVCSEKEWHLNMMEPYGEIMADRAFKIREDLMIHTAKLCIPPSHTLFMQLLPHDVRETSNTANVRIYVKRAIGWIEVFLLKNKLPITLLPLDHDIICVCCALCNLPSPFYLIFLFTNMLSFLKKYSTLTG